MECKDLPVGEIHTCRLVILCVVYDRSIRQTVRLGDEVDYVHLDVTQGYMSRFGSYPYRVGRKTKRKKKNKKHILGTRHIPYRSRIASRPKRHRARWDCPNSDRVVFGRRGGDSIPPSLGRIPMPNLRVFCVNARFPRKGVQMSESALYVRSDDTQAAHPP